jgi:3-methyl-2-oxobutanoate hydroxymethyltransferase
VRPKTTIARLQDMKRDGEKIVGVVVYDYPMARIADRAGVDIVSVGDSVGVNMWGHAAEDDITIDEMLVVCKAVRRGVEHALLSCDVPASANHVEAARVLVKDGGADLVKVEAGPETIRTLVDAGIGVWAQMSGQGAGGRAQEVSAEEVTGLVREAQALEAAGASLLDFRYSGPVAGPAVTRALSIPVIGGLGGGPWLDGRVRAVVNAIGYSAAALDDQADRYANVSRVALDAITAYAGDVRAGRQVKGK